MSWTDDQPPGLRAAADQELAGLRGWIRELATEHPHVKEHVGAMGALFTLAKHIENAVDARPGMPNAWLIAAAAVDTLTATQADADKWEKRYAEMLAQRDTALQAAGEARAERDYLRRTLDTANATNAAAQRIVTAALADGTATITPTAAPDACPLDEGAQLYEPDSCPGGGPTCVFYPTRHVHPVEPPAGVAE